MKYSGRLIAKCLLALAIAGTAPELFAEDDILTFKDWRGGAQAVTGYGDPAYLAFTISKANDAVLYVACRDLSDKGYLAYLEIVLPGVKLPVAKTKILATAGDKLIGMYTAYVAPLKSGSTRITITFDDALKKHLYEGTSITFGDGKTGVTFSLMGSTQALGWFNGNCPYNVNGPFDEPAEVKKNTKRIHIPGQYKGDA